jgi:hypothetical protein
MVCSLLNLAFNTEISRFYAPLRKCIVHPIRLLSGVKKCVIFTKRDFAVCLVDLA